MKKNVSKPDMLVRFIFGVITMALSFTNFFEDDFMGNVLLYFGVYTVITGVFRFCFIYYFLGIDTNKPKSKMKMY